MNIHVHVCKYAKGQYLMAPLQSEPFSEVTGLELLESCEYGEPAIWCEARLKVQSYTVVPLFCNPLF